VGANTEKERNTSLMRETWQRLLHNKAATVGLLFIVLLAALSLCADFFYDYETDVITQNISNRLIPPSWEHPFGTDDLGRDLLARIVYGSRTSLIVSFCSVALSLLVGGTLGAVSGYYGGLIDGIIMRVTDVLLAIPMTLFAIVIVATLGANTVNLTLALAASSVPIFARIVRGAVLTVRDMEYVEAARAIGARNGKIILKHVLPNCLAPIIVQVTLRIANAIYNTAALSFLGMGVQPPAPEWGGLLASGRNYIRDYSYLSIIPGLTIMVTILALNLLGDGLRDSLDPRLRQG
jgi:peptide/nickel transport system permease protein